MTESIRFRRQRNYGVLAGLSAKSDFRELFLLWL